MGLSTTSQNRFFMTRQIANVLEDLDRQISSTASISLLYGVSGVGKSRLLQQFISSRLQNSHTIYLNFSADGTYVHNDSSFSQLQFSDNILQRLEAHTVLVLDQFEHALSEVQRRILTFWSTEAKHKGLKLVLCGTQQVVADLSALSKKISGNINSLELKPLSDKERAEYLAVQICKSSNSYPGFPRHIIKLIKQSNGLFSNLDSLCQQHSGSIDCQRKATTSKTVFSFTGVIVALALLITAVVVFNLPDNRVSNVIIEQQTIQPAKLPGFEESKVAMQSAEIVIENRVVSDAQDQSANNHEVDSSQSEQLNTQAQTLTEKPENKPQEMKTPSRQEHNVLQKRLLATEHWLADADDRSASIQVMTLSLGSDAVTSLKQYLVKIEQRGVNLENIFVYTAPKKDSHVYGVLYGKYSSRQQAIQQLNTLPEILKADKPIPRTVIGIKQEIKKNKLL